MAGDSLSEQEVLERKTLALRVVGMGMGGDGSVGRLAYQRQRCCPSGIAAEEILLMG